MPFINVLSTIQYNNFALNHYYYSINYNRSGNYHHVHKHPLNVLTHTRETNIGVVCKTNYWEMLLGIIDHGQDGLIVQPISTSIATGINQLLDNPSWRHELGCRGYRKVRANYDWQQVTIQMSKIYATIRHPYV